MTVTLDPPATDRTGIYANQALRRAQPGEIGSHFDNCTTCTWDRCAPAAYRNRPLPGRENLGVVILCAHGHVRTSLTDPYHARQLPYNAPFILIRKARSRG
jgi:hypothetical protein